ncbi:glycosyltransferase [Candidatus Flexifilum breve]|uniref:glycosyltransferase family 2 protein n=1 Tax=Candidatus Flexifilum breve TaxID=3140694 RepID=UPI0031CC4411
MQMKTAEKRSTPSAKRLTLSVLIPCYSERDTIEAVLDRVEAVGLADEIIIVDDGSTDGTLEVLRQIEAQNRPH